MSKASDYRKRRRAAQEPTAEVALPSGAVFVCRRPPLEVWIAAGKIPQSFLRQYLGKEAGEGQQEISGEDTVSAVLFLREAIMYAVVEPRLVVGATNDDELDPSDLSPDDFEFLTQWVMTGSPGVPVKTKGGEVALDSLSRFRQKRPGGRPFSLEPDGGEIQQETERASRVG